MALSDACYQAQHLIRDPSEIAGIIYKQSKNLPAVQLLLGHSKLESTARYLGIEVGDALEVAEQM